MRYLSMWILIGLFFCAISSFGAVTSQEYLDAGKSLYHKNQFDQAAKYLKAAVQTDPQNWDAYVALGNCLFKQNQLSDALDAFDKSLALHPDNPGVKTFSDALRKKVSAASSSAPPPLPHMSAGGSSTAANTGGFTPPPLPPLGTTASPAKPEDNFSASMETADGKLHYYGLNPKDHPLLEEYYAGKDLEDRSRSALKLEDQTKLNADEKSVELWDGPKSQFYDPHFSLLFGVITPTGIDLDLGYFISPDTNVGASLCYIPLSTSDYTYTYNSQTGYDTYTPTNYSGNLIYIEPRIKFYSAPSGLNSYHGFSVIYYGVHQGAVDDTNFDIFGLGYLFGFRTLPMDGMTMELGWKVGVAVIFIAENDYTEIYSNGHYSETYTPTTTVVPFPYIIPEFKFGFTF